MSGTWYKLDKIMRTLANGAFQYQQFHPKSSKHIFLILPYKPSQCTTNIAMAKSIGTQKMSRLLNTINILDKHIHRPLTLQN